MLDKRQININIATKKFIFFALAAALFVFLVSCSKNNDVQNAFPVGIWQGTFEDKPLSLEFKNNGCMILISEGEDAIGFGKYSIDITKQPGHLDLEFIEPKWKPFITLIEKIDNNTFRTEIVEGQTSRLAAFSDGVILMKRVNSHVVPDMKTAEQRDEELKELSFKESIWFETKEHDKLLDICEALFRYQFKNNASGAQQNAEAYFLSIYEADPPKDLMARFEKSIPHVKLGSEFKVGSGLKFRIRSVKMLDKNNVEIEGGYYEAGLSSSGNTYQLQKKNSKWQVISDKMKWIS